MAKSFMSTRKSSAELADKLSKLGKNSNYEKDDRFWEVTKDKAGNGTAVIRFLPAPPAREEDRDCEDSFAIKYYSHSFKNKSTGQWYIERSLTTIGKQDKMAIENSKLWNSGDEDKKKIASSRARRTNFVSNILVVNDKANPENNGQVKLFRYPQQVLTKIEKKMIASDDVPEEETVNVIDFIDGANFRLRVVDKKGFPNYEQSEFLSPTPVSDDEDELQRIWESEYSLEELTDLKHYKSEEELEKAYDRVFPKGSVVEADDNEEATPSNMTRRSTRLVETDEGDETQSNAESNDSMVEEKSTEKPKFNPTKKKEETVSTKKAETKATVEDDDDDMKFLQNLANKKK